MPVQELEQCGSAGLGCLLLKGVPEIKGLALDMGCFLTPSGDDVVELSYRALGSPESQERCFDSLVGIGCVVLEIDAGGCAVVFTYGVNRSRLAITAQIFLDVLLAGYTRGSALGGEVTA